MIIEYNLYCYRVILTQIEEDLGIQTGDGFFLNGYEKRPEAVYYPSIIGSEPIFDVYNDNFYTFKNKTYGDVVATASAEGNNIFKKNNWIITYDNKLILKPTEVTPYIWQCQLTNPYLKTHYTGIIAKEGDIMVFKSSKGTTINYTLPNYFKYDLDMNTGLMTFLNYGG